MVDIRKVLLSCAFLYKRANANLSSENIIMHVPVHSHVVLSFMTSIKT